MEPLTNLLDKEDYLNEDVKAILPKCFAQIAVKDSLLRKWQKEILLKARSNSLVVK